MGEVSRRALLGAAAALPLMAQSRLTPGPLHHPSGGSPPRPGEEFEAALAAYRAAEAEVRGFEARTAGRAFVAEDPLDEVYGELGDVMYDALRGLLKAPAPDVGALAVKMDLVVEHEVGTLDGGEACFKAMRGDAHRLAKRPEGPSRN